MDRRKKPSFVITTTAVKGLAHGFKSWGLNLKPFLLILYHSPSPLVSAIIVMSHVLVVCTVEYQAEWKVERYQKQSRYQDVLLIRAFEVLSVIRASAKCHEYKCVCKVHSIVLSILT